MPQTPETVARIRLTPDKIREMLDVLDRSEELPGGGANRKHTRWRFRLSEALRMVCLRQGGHVVYEMAPRNLSAKGLAGLVGGFIHAGTPCALSLPMSDGERIRVGGAVRSCRHVSGIVHEVGIEFHQAVEIGCFVESGDAETVPTRAFLDELERYAVKLSMLAREGAPWTDLRRAIREIQQLAGGVGC